MIEAEPSRDAFHLALELACQCPHIGKITAGRHQVLSFPRTWVLEQIEQVAVEVLDLSDEWEYRRFLELALLIDVELMQRFVALGLNSIDPDIREAAEDFRQRAADEGLLTEMRDRLTPTRWPGQ
jgi:hypothetical protein